MQYVAPFPSADQQRAAEEAERETSRMYRVMATLAARQDRRKKEEDSKLVKRARTGTSTSTGRLSKGSLPAHTGSTSKGGRDASQHLRPASKAGYNAARSLRSYAVQTHRSQTDTRSSTPVSAYASDQRTEFRCNCLRQGSSALRVACSRGHASCVAILLHSIAPLDVNDVGVEGESPLWLACANGQAACAERLLSRSADADQADRKGVAPLFVSSIRGNADCVALLCKWGAVVNAPTPLGPTREAGRTALWAACAGGHLGCVQTLCAYGARRQWQRRSEAPETAEEVAAHSHVSEWLVRTRDYITTLHFLGYLPPQRVRTLLRSGADPHARADSSAPSPLQLARLLYAPLPPPQGSAAWLVVQASQPWSPKTHAFFPAQARARAVELLLVGVALARSARCSGSAIEDVWVDSVMPHAITRASVTLRKRTQQQ